MTEPTEADIRKAHAEDARDGGHMESSAESRRKRWAAHEHRAVLLRLLDEARTEVSSLKDRVQIRAGHVMDLQEAKTRLEAEREAATAEIKLLREEMAVCVGERDEARAELGEIDAALDASTKCVAPTRAQRIRDTLEINRRSADAAVFDAEKAEQSVRQQCTYWMGEAKIAADTMRTLRAERDEAMKYAGHKWACASLVIEEDERGIDTGDRYPCDCGFDAMCAMVRK